MYTYVIFTRHIILTRALGLSIGLFLASLSASAQQTKPDSQQVTWPHDDLRDAEFPGGRKALAAYMRQHVQYPDSAAQARITGRVFVSFVIDTTGQVSNLTVLKSLGYGCDREAVRVIKAMPRWIPGTQSGKPIRVKYNLPILFPPN